MTPQTKMPRVCGTRGWRHTDDALEAPVDETSVPDGTAQSKSVAIRVAAGAALLDEREPDWAARIDLGRLDLSCWEYCILAQLHDDGSFTAGIDALGLKDEGRLHGFERDQSVTYAELDGLWREEIAKRLVAA